MRPTSTIPAPKQERVHLHGALLIGRTIQDCGCLLLALFAGLLLQAETPNDNLHRHLTSSSQIDILRLLTLFSLYAAILLSQLQSRTRSWLQLTRASGVSLAAILLLVALLGIQPVLPTPLFVAVLTAFLLLTLSSVSNRNRTESFLHNALQKNVIVLGTQRTAPLLESHLMALQERHLHVVLTIDAEEMLRPGEHALFESWLPAVSRQHFADEIAVCGLHPELVDVVVSAARRQGIAVRLVPDLLSEPADYPATEFLGHLPTFCLNQRRIDFTAVIAKRALDLLCAGFALFLLLPFCLLLVVLIKMDSRGPVLYRSQRVGRKGRIFWCWKFRTMVPNADCLKQSLQHMNERDGVLFKITNDPRITGIGRHLRKYSLDELPQLLNVLKGDMSLVGPRPPLAEEVAQYDAEQRQRLAVHPGITGLWQVEARANPSFDRYMELDLRYVREWNFKLDLQILLRTVQVVIAGTGQ